MTLKTPLMMQAQASDAAISYSALDTRAILARLVRTEGILIPDSTAGGLKATQRAAGANLSVDVAAGSCCVQGDDVALQGKYLLESDATVNLAIPAPPASGTRVHRVVAQVRDKLHNGTYTTYDWVLQVLQDTGSGTPALPNTAISLARVSVAAGQSSVTNANITDDRFDAGLATARPSSVSADANRPPNPWDGQVTSRSDFGGLEVAVGGSWFELARRDGGGTAWTPYSPTLTAATTNPTMGATTIVGSYYKVGRMVSFRAQFLLGTGWAGGSGQYTVSLPFTAASTVSQYGQAKYFDSTTGGSQHWWGSCTIGAASTNASLFVPIGTTDGSLRGVSNNQPMVWAVGDQLNVWGTYEASS